MVVKNADMLTDLKISSSKIKDVSGKGVQITGTGKLVLPLKSDYGDINIIHNLDTVLMHTRPYNLIPS